MARPVLLNLDTLVVRPLVVIDGTEYEMLNPGELTLLQLHQFGVMGSDLQAAISAATTSPDIASFTSAQVASVAALLDRMVRMILKAPPELVSRLSDGHKFQVVSAFNTLTPMTQPVPNVSTPPAGAETPTGEKS
jgi:hypothetical protein